jgi:predicted kinase
MSKLLILKGLPASGKSTHAFELVKKGWKRVNKDDLRVMVDGGQWSKENERYILGVETGLATDFLESGFNVVVDDTNFAHEEHWKQQAEAFGADFEVKNFDVSLTECIERDIKRGAKSVGAKVIQRMYDKYLKPKPPEWSEDKQNCYVFDVDGTLAKRCCPIHQF